MVGGDVMTAAVLPWWQQRLLALDVETTGVDPHEDRIVTASKVYLAGNLRPTARTWIINPGIPVPDGAAEIHGWTTERLQAHPEAREPGEALFELVGQIALAMNRSPGMPLVVMNGSFDLTMLEAECARHDVDPLSSRLDRGLRPVVDVMVLDKQQDPYRPSRCDGKQKRAPRCTCGADGKKLVDLARHYGVLLGDAHAAHADALAACRLLGRLIEKWPELGSCTPDELHDAQVGWRAEQSTSLASYFRRMGEHEKAESVCGSWPLHGDCCRTTAQAVAS